MINSGAYRARVAFRVDASLEIGTGHVMRCLTLADALRARGADCLFLCRAHTGHLREQITARGHSVRLLSPSVAVTAAWPDAPLHYNWLASSWETDAADTCNLLAGTSVDWLVVDHYALDSRWERAVRQACDRLMVMDDLADRPHDCDLLLDPSLGRTLADYRDRLPMGATALLGPQFAPLRPEFAALRKESLARRGVTRIERILITMGGVDKDNATGRVLAALNSCSGLENLSIIVVMGLHAPWLADVRKQAAEMTVPASVRVAVENMATLMAESDMAIGAAGGTSWERCCMGLPTIQFVVADNQAGIADQLARVGAAICADVETLPKIFAELAGGGAKEQLAKQSRIASLITDGLGVERTAAELMRSRQ